MGEPKELVWLTSILASARQRPRKGDATRATILAAAARRFAEKNYADCSLREIADLAGLKAGSVYYHFASKEALLDDVLLAGIDRLTATIRQRIADLGEGATATRQLKAMIRAHVTSFLDVRDNANTYLRIYDHLPPIMKRRTRPNRLHYAQIWFDAFDRGVTSGEFAPDIEPTLFISLLLDSMNGVIEWFRPSRMTIDGVCETIETALLTGILTAAARSAEAGPGASARRQSRTG